MIMCIVIALILSCVMMPSGESHSNDLNIYLQYLLKFKKSTMRLDEANRVSSFYESFLFVKNFEDNHQRNNDTLIAFTVGFNEMSDWLPSETASMFTTDFQSKIPTAVRLSTGEDRDSVVTVQNNDAGDQNMIESNKSKRQSEEDIVPLLKDSGVIAAAEQPQSRRVRGGMAVSEGIISVDDNIKEHSKLLSQLVTNDKRESRNQNKRILGSTDGVVDYVNWVTTTNSKGFPVLANVRNQGMCGACWAFVAAASVEAQVRISGGKQIPLSVQELIDCDTALNRGCEGGNPLYAFEYTMANALTSWDDYPYKEIESTCHRKKLKARSSVDGYRRLLSNNQQLLEQYVSMAPVAVGICGTDKSFMFYVRGVYNAASCCSIQNHAVLLVGYGHDTVTGLDYWTALNSWGVMWGERGYIRLLRTNESSPGQCGLAMNPIIALGGYVLNKNDLDLSDNHSSSEGGGGKDNRKSNVHNLPFGASFIEWIGRHWKSICIFLASCLMMFSLGLLGLASYIDYIQSSTHRRCGDRSTDLLPSHNTASYNEVAHDEICDAVPAFLPT